VAYDYKARIYSAGNGRFWQTDPIGTADDLNYSYSHNSPLQFEDPSGEAAAPCPAEEVCVTAPRLPRLPFQALAALRIVSIVVSNMWVGALRIAFDPTLQPLSDGHACGTSMSCGVTIDEKIKQQLKDRGWTEDEIQEAIKNGIVGDTRDQRGPGKTPDGQKRDESAHVYGSKTAYVVINQQGEVVQVSDKNGPWVPDSRIT